MILWILACSIFGQPAADGQPADCRATCKQLAADGKLQAGTTWEDCVRHMACDARSSPAGLWSWFAAHEAQLRTGDPVDVGTLEKLTRVLEGHHPSLVAEVGMGQEGGPWTLVISAQGIRQAIPTVQALVAAAPPLEGWKVVAFRQPRALDEFQLSMGGTTLDASDLRVDATQAGGPLDVEVVVPGCDGLGFDGCGQIAFLALDHALGEHAVMTRIRNVTWRSPGAPAALSLAELQQKVGVTPE